MDKFRLDNKVAILTGAGSGIGRATAMAFAQRGAKLALIDVNKENMESVSKTIEQEGVFHKYYVSDVSDFQALQSVFRDILDQFKQIDILVNVAGIWEAMPFLELPMANIDKLFAVNFKGCVHCIKLALPSMVARRYGRIVSVSSVAGKEGSGLGSSHYGASKAAVMALSCSIAREFGTYAITSNVVCPGVIDTSMAKLLGETTIEAYVKQRCPLKRLGQPEEVAAVIAFLSSDAASFVTGQAWNVCGGSRLD